MERKIVKLELEISYDPEAVDVAGISEAIGGYIQELPEYVRLVSIKEKKE